MTGVTGVTDGVTDGVTASASEQASPQPPEAAISTKATGRATVSDEQVNRVLGRVCYE